MKFYYGPTPTEVSAMEILSYTDPSVAADNTSSCTVTLRQFEGDKYDTFKDVQNQFGGLRDNDTSTIWYFAGRIGNVQFPTPTTVVLMIEGESSKLNDKPCPGIPTALGTFSGNYDLLDARGFAKQRVKEVNPWGHADTILLENDDDTAGDPVFDEDEWNSGSQDCGALLTDTTDSLTETWLLTAVDDAASPYDPDSIAPDPHVPANTNAANDDLYVGWRTASSAKVIHSKLTLDGDDIPKTNYGQQIILKWRFRIGVRWTDATHKSFLNYLKLYLHSNGMYNETFDGENYALVGTCGACNPTSGEALKYYIWEGEKVLPGYYFTELLHSDANNWTSEEAYVVINTSTYNNTQVDIDLDYISLKLEYRTMDFSPINAQVTDSGKVLEAINEPFTTGHTTGNFPSNVNDLTWTDSDSGAGAATTVEQDDQMDGDANNKLLKQIPGAGYAAALATFSASILDPIIEFSINTNVAAGKTVKVQVRDTFPQNQMGIEFKSDGHAYGMDSTGTAYTIDLGVYATAHGTHTHYKIYIHASARTYDVDVDGVRVVTATAFGAFGAANLYTGAIYFYTTDDFAFFDALIISETAWSWIKCASINFYTLGVNAGDKVKIGQNTRTIALDVGSYCDVIVDPDPLFTKYMATNYKASPGRIVIQRICELEQGHWADAWNTSGTPKAVLRKTSSFEASAYTIGAGLTSAHFHKNFDIQRPMNQYKGVEGWGNAENGIHWLEIDDTDSNTSPLIDPIKDDAIMTTGDMKTICYAKLQELKVLRPSIKIVLEAKAGDANYANIALLQPLQTAYVTFERPTIAETKYEIRRVDKHQTHPNGKLVVTVYLGLGLTPPEEEAGRVIGKIIREVASARSSLISPRVLGDLSLYLKKAGGTLTGDMAFAANKGITGEVIPVLNPLTGFSGFVWGDLVLYAALSDADAYVTCSWYVKTGGSFKIRVCYIMTDTTNPCNGHCHAGHTHANAAAVSLLDLIDANWDLAGGTANKYYEAESAALAVDANALVTFKWAKRDVGSANHLYLYGVALIRQ